MFIYQIDEKTTLKMLTPQDTEPLFRLTDQSRESLRELLPFIDYTKTSADTAAFITATMKQLGDNNGFQVGILYEEKLAGVI